MKKILLIAEKFSYPFDEGWKNLTYCLIKAINNRPDMCTLRVVIKNKKNAEIPTDMESLRLNMFFLNKALWRLLQNYQPDILVYIPGSSGTFNSFIRARILKLMARHAQTAILSLQYRRFRPFYGYLLRFLRPDILLSLSRQEKFFFEKKGLEVKVLPPAVDSRKFHRVEEKTRIVLRKKYCLPENKIIICHTGGITPIRNLEILGEVQKIDDVQVVIAGSTTTQADNDLKKILERMGIVIINRYLPDIQEIYQLSDVYIFPVRDRMAAIEMPLSVLEAMACNLPVITTRFGGLNDCFVEDDGFRYFETVHELIGLAKSMHKNTIANDQKVKGFSWDRFFDEIINSFQGLACVKRST